MMGSPQYLPAYRGDSITKNNFSIYFNSIFVLLMLVSCSKNQISLSDDPRSERNKNYSSLYNHFEGGVLFTDVEQGLDVLWKASFVIGSVVYKENLAYFVQEGLLILPNSENTRRTSQMAALRHYQDDGKLFVIFEDRPLQVLGIIHTHPDIYSVESPAPINDYQYGFLGLHNYVISHLHLFDAYKNDQGHEVFEILGPRKTYIRTPFKISNDNFHVSLTIGRSIYRTKINPLKGVDGIAAVHLVDHRLFTSEPISARVPSH